MSSLYSYCLSLVCNKFPEMLHLETTHIDYLAVSLSWPSGHSSTEPSAVSFVACSKGITQTVFFSGGWRFFSFKLTWLLAEFSSFHPED